MSKIKIEKEKIVKCMVENQGGCVIGIIRDERTDDIEVISYERGWLKTYCEQNQKELIESFNHYPADNGYDEENPYTEEDAYYELGNIVFNNFEVI